MNQYYISPKALYHILKDKGITSFYHANTVLTSLTFIENKGLLSRAYVEENGLFQTPQESDEADKLYDVWDNIFLDGLDLHKRFLRANNYGPILFVLKLEILLAPELPNILITKNNPWYWKPSTKIDDRYYSNIEDISRDYLTGKILDSRIMFTFQSPSNFIKLSKFLREIIIDNPNIILTNKSTISKNVGDLTFETISNKLKEKGLGHIPLIQRHQNKKISWCKCYINYNTIHITKRNEFNKRFNPKYK